jgi:hypothetical protein
LCSENGNWGWNLALFNMRRPLDIDTIFPITDAASAALMAIKADCLRRAGVVSDQEKERVDDRIRTFLQEAALKGAADMVGAVMGSGDFTDDRSQALHSVMNESDTRQRRRKEIAPA